MTAQHTYTEACDGHHEGPCPVPPVTQRHLISTSPISWVDQLSDADLDRLAARIVKGGHLEKQRRLQGRRWP
jgi:hypothetical protein